MAAKTYEIAFKLAGQMSSNFTKTFNAASTALKGFGSELADLNRKSSQLDGVIKQRQAVGQAAREYMQARNKVAELGRAMSATEAPTKKMVAEFNRAQTAAQKAKTALDNKRASLRQMETAAGTAGTSLKNLIARQKELEAATDRARISQERFANTVGGMKGNVAGMKESAPYASMSGAAMGAGLMTAINAGMNFEKTMSTVAAVSRASTEDLAKLTAQAKQLGADTEWSASEAAEGMTYLAMAGFKTEQTLKAMPSMLSLATAGSIDLGRAADISSNILTGFGLEAGEMARVSDVLVNTFTSSNTTLEMLGNTMKYAAPVAKNMGVSIEEAAAMAGKLGDAGIQGEMAGTTLRAVLLRLSAPSKAGADALAELGVNTTDAAGNMRKFPAILGDLQKAMSGMSEEARAKYTKAIFETEAMSGAMVLMEQAGKGALDPYVESLKKAGTAAETAKGKQNNLAGDMKELQSKLEATGIAIYESLLPSLREMAQRVTSIISNVQKWITNNQSLTKTIAFIAGGLSVAAAAALPMLMIWKTLQFYGNAFMLVVRGLSLAFQRQTYVLIANKAAMVAQKVSMIASKAAMIAHKVATYAAAAATKMWTVAQWAWNAAMTANPIGLIIVAIGALIAIGVALYMNWDKITAYCVEMWNTFKTKFPAMAGIFTSAFNRIKNIATSVKNIFVNLIGFVKNVFTGQWSAAWGNVKEIFSSYFSVLAEAVRLPFNSIISIINIAIKGINSALGKIKIPDWVPIFGGKSFSLNIPTIPQLAQGGIATKPTLAMIGEGREDEAVLPLSKLSGMLGATGGRGEVKVSFSPTINVYGGGSDAYSRIEQGLREGANNLKRELEKLLLNERRLSYM